MQITRGFKYTPEQFNSESFEVTASHEELGLPTPATPEELRDTVRQMALQLEGICLIERVKHGLIQGDTLSDRLRPWLPTS